jgi:glycosyltransferase involved in cell wall biosynthesis
MEKINYGHKMDGITLFAICICTYKRAYLLEKLIRDLTNQSCLPNYLIVIDGDPNSGAVAGMMASLKLHPKLCTIYLPSNHGNLSYQRYLGWKVATRMNCDILLYFDDDLRISQRYSVAKTIAPLFWNKNIVGVTGNTSTGDLSKHANSEALVDRVKSGRLSFLVQWFGAARNLPPGSLSPSGHRCAPRDRGMDYESVEWLQGRVMAYKMAALTEACFSEDLFALDHIRCGLGEDTFLSRRVGTSGKLLMAYCAHFEHPDDDLPKSYPYQAFKFGYATAYSRRLLNDYYRGFAPPLFSDRVALVKSYLGTSMLNWWWALSTPRRHRFAYAGGYTWGALRGLIQKPTAKNLTPNIDWWKDADAAMQNLVILREPQHE